MTESTSSISEHSPGPARAYSVGLGAAIEIRDANYRHVASCWRAGKGQQKRNAEIFAEALTVATETGMTPRQLAEENARLQAELEVSELAREGARQSAEMHKRLCDHELETSRKLAEELAALKSDREEMMESLTGVLKLCDGACRLDRDGNCQTHFIGNPCVVGVARAVLAKAEKGGQA